MVKFITRADDLGSIRSANRAIESVTQAGFIKNVSVMAPGPFVSEAADMLAAHKDICFGMHITVNAEWDRVKWKPVSALADDSGLLDANGFFLLDPSHFLSTKPAVETIMAEVDAQLERLHSLGFNITYMDSHMGSELFVPGLDDAFRDFALKKGLLDHMHYYNMPPGFSELNGPFDEILRKLQAIPDGQYFLITHPSQDTDEMRQTGNASVSGEAVAKGRAAETALFSQQGLFETLAAIGVYGIRYDEAIPRPRFTADSFRHMFTGGDD
jgi:predicted glycoside hydrolase/deacetylase ChbG (UPF0249 family)